MMTTRSIQQARKSLAAALSVGLALSACDVLDVNNPNNLTEESIERATAANAVVNGALAQNSRAISQQWLGYLAGSDEIVWIGSRDAWGQLDQGFFSNPANEFTDAAFPQVGQARWLADEAVVILDGHVAEAPSDALKHDQARAYVQAGLIYTIIGETQEDFAFSDKMEGVAAIGPETMVSVFDQAIEYLSTAITLSQALGAAGADLMDNAQALRARAYHSRAIWGKIKPSVNTAAPLVNAPNAVSDAAAVISRVEDSWRYQLTYSSSTLSGLMSSEINSRGELQFDTTSVVQVNSGAPKAIQGIKLADPIDDIPDPRIRAFLVEWKGDEDISKPGTTFSPLTITSAKHMHLILAEDELAKGNMAGFTTHINHVRTVDNLTPYSGQIPALDMLQYERRAALFVTGVRLLDMYRFGVTDPLWAPGSDAVQSPGTLLPITCIERDANPNIPDC